MNDWTEFIEKSKNREIEKFVSEFQAVSGNDNEWNKVKNKYEASKIWLEIRDNAIKAAKGRCQKCGNLERHLQVHHVNYFRIGGKEKPEDLMALCYSCHQKADKQRESKTNERYLDAKYEGRVTDYAINKYGACWSDDFIFSEIEEEFLRMLFRQNIHKLSDEFHVNFSPNLDENDEHISSDEFREMVHNEEY